jgi:hypothetical protein
MKEFSPFFLKTVACLGLSIPSAVFAQQSDLLVAAVDGSNTVATVSVPVAKPVVAAQPLFGRWLDLETLSHSERYRNAFAVGGTHVFENAQQRSLIEGKIKLDSEGRYDIGFRASSGRYFNWAYAGYTGASFITDIYSRSFQGSYFTPAESFAVLEAEWLINRA